MPKPTRDQVSAATKFPRFSYGQQDVSLRTRTNAERQEDLKTLMELCKDVRVGGQLTRKLPWPQAGTPLVIQRSLSNEDKELVRGAENTIAFLEKVVFSYPPRSHLQTKAFLQIYAQMVPNRYMANIGVYNAVRVALERILLKGSSQGWKATNAPGNEANPPTPEALEALMVYGGAEKGLGTMSEAIESLLKNTGLYFLLVEPTKRVIPAYWHQYYTQVADWQRGIDYASYEGEKVSRKKAKGRGKETQATGEEGQGQTVKSDAPSKGTDPSGPSQANDGPESDATAGNATSAPGSSDAQGKEATRPSLAPDIHLPVPEKKGGPQGLTKPSGDLELRGALPASQSMRDAQLNYSVATTNRILASSSNESVKIDALTLSTTVEHVQTLASKVKVLEAVIKACGARIERLEAGLKQEEERAAQREKELTERIEKYEEERNAASNESDEGDLVSLLDLMFKTRTSAGTGTKEPSEGPQDDAEDSGGEPSISVGSPEENQTRVEDGLTPVTIAPVLNPLPTTETLKRTLPDSQGDGVVQESKRAKTADPPGGSAADGGDQKAEAPVNQAAAPQPEQKKPKDSSSSLFGDGNIFSGYRYG